VENSGTVTCRHSLPSNTFRNETSHFWFKAANLYCSWSYWEICPELGHLQGSLFFKDPTKICTYDVFQQCHWQEKENEPCLQVSVMWLLKPDCVAAGISLELHQRPAVWAMWKQCWCRKPAWCLSNKSYPQSPFILWYLVQIWQDLQPEHGICLPGPLFSLFCSIIVCHASVKWLRALFWWYSPWCEV